jgi:hypothetical protein
MAGRGGITSLQYLLNNESIAKNGNSTSAWISYASPISGAFYVDMDSSGAADITITMDYSPYSKEYLANLVAGGTTLTTEHYITETLSANNTTKTLQKLTTTTLDNPIGSLRVKVTENNVAACTVTVIFASFSID